MIKKRSRPPPRIREHTLETEDLVEGNDKIPLADLVELRKFRRSRQGIDVGKLNQGELKRRKRQIEEGEGEPKGGLIKTDTFQTKGEEEEDDEDEDAKARKVVRANNFTQQTNALDVDKHMMAYIEENLKLRHDRKDTPEIQNEDPLDPHEELFRIADRYKIHKKVADEGSVTNSISMLTAIPEVDLGMDTRLKNIEETEKAKRMVADERKERGKFVANDEEHLAAARFYRPNLRQKSDADIMRDAKLEAIGLPPEDEPRRPYNERNQMATDDLVMERFKKRIRK